LSFFLGVLVSIYNAINCPRHTLIEGYASVWGSEFTTKAASLQATGGKGFSRVRTSLKRKFRLSGGGRCGRGGRGGDSVASFHVLINKLRAE
jgi:hypothetical protein